MGALSLVSHTTLSIVYAYSIYIYCWGVFPPEELRKMRETNFGPFKYLTFWDLLLQCLFFTLCSIADFTTLQQSNKARKSSLQSALDFIFTTIVFSTASFVAISFWSLYAIDRALIFPVIYDTFFPRWLNHVVHTLPLAAVLLELFAVNHSFPSQRKGFFTVTLFTLLYLGWVLYIASTTGHWVYPILDRLSEVGRVSFVVVMCVLIGLFYILGYGLQSLRWGHERQDPQLIYHKKK